ncbi:MAG: FAD-dependent oxidoreductase [Clostridiales bacterium]|nr:FAD-dependent oxidoreductase [Clostridiales bacterium]
MIRIDQYKTPVGQLPTTEEIARFLKIETQQIRSWNMVRRSLDARRGHEPQFVLVLDVEIAEEARYLKRKKLPQGVHGKQEIPMFRPPYLGQRMAERPTPIVVGFGPAGLFCALMLARAGLKPLVIERGDPVEERSQQVERFWTAKTLDPDSNVQFGEGGAGTFSDGKLNTLIKDKEQLGRLVLTEMVKAGAPEEILYDAKPHIGTDRLQPMVRNIREEIRSLGGTVRFRTRLDGLRRTESGLLQADVTCCGRTEALETDALFLCIGHSARDTFAMLEQSGIAMTAKAFAMGVRVEHLQSWIDQARYHGDADRLREIVGAADYKVTHTASNGRGVYSFCMCPGGTVVASASEEGRLVTNGMSCYARDGKNANSALIVTVTPDDYAVFAQKENDVLAGVRMQQDLERRAFLLGGGAYQAPVQRVEDFHLRRASSSFGVVEPTYTAGVTPADLWEILPEFMGQALEEGLKAFDQSIQGFDHPDALLTGIESRTSSPVRILRDPETLMSSLKGLYPVGEGAGYAGGIMSAAIDGIKAARAYLTSWQV